MSPPRLLAALTLALVGGLSACGPSPAEAPRPLLFVGVDGFEWDVVLPLLEEERLPNLARLMRGGTYGELRSLKPTISPVIWTSIATGVGKERHGITDFLVKGQGRTTSSNDRRVKAFWNVLGDFGKRVGVVGWWATWPAEAVNGAMVAQFNVVDPKLGLTHDSRFDPRPHQVHPSSLEEPAREAVRAVGAELAAHSKRIFGGEWAPSLGALPNRLWANSQWSLRADAIYQRLALQLLADEEPFDVFAVYFGGPDVLGHAFWRYLDPDAYATPPSPEEIEALGTLIPDYYVHIDEVIGQLADAMPEGSRTLVMSDHGMEAIATSASPADRRRLQRGNSGGHSEGPAAFFVASGAGVRQSGALPRDRQEVVELGSVLDVFPTLCVLQGLPLADDLEGRPLERVVEGRLLSAHSAGTVPSFTSDDWHATRSKPISHRPGTDERIEQLRNLGYVE